MPGFDDLPLPAPLREALTRLGYTDPTPIQAAALPPLLDGRDLVARARTGSGKTAAFGLGLLARLRADANAVQALVLCPTRELATQVGRDIRRLAQCMPGIKLTTLAGGVPLAPQAASLSQAPHVVVGTPGRVLDHLDRGHLQLSAAHMLVLDEADRMLDMGFADDLARIAASLPKQRQTLLFSATWNADVDAVSQRLQRQAVVLGDADEAPPPAIEQQWLSVEEDQRERVIAELLLQRTPPAALVFCDTRADCRQLVATLRGRGLPALALHGEMEQRDRDEALLQFANHSCTVLVATDVAARGLHIADLPLVISHRPSTDPDVHVHRIGRTGRAGAEGLAVHLCGPGDGGRLKRIAARIGSEPTPLPFRGAEISPPPMEAPMATLRIDGGRRQKLRAGDILGALTGEAGLAAADIGRIDIFDDHSYVAIQRPLAGRALARLRQGRIKNRRFRIWPLDGQPARAASRPVRRRNG